MPNSSRIDPEDQNNPGYEKRDVNLNKVILYGVIGMIILVVAIVFVVDYFTAVKEEVIYESTLKPESAALRELRARETEELGSYKLLDSARGIYRIPVERAKELIADEAYRDRMKAAPER
jgi:hypothetical protein